MFAMVHASENSPSSTDINFFSVSVEAATRRIDFESGEVKFETLNGDCFSLLHYSAWHRRLNEVEYLIDNDYVNIEAQTKYDNFTVLHLSVLRGDEAILKYLLRSGANIEAMTKERFTALHIAASIGNVRIAKILLSFRANIEAKTNALGTPLLIAIAVNCAEMVQLLLEHGADMKARTIDDCTPFFLAARLDQRHIKTLLFKNMITLWKRSDQNKRSDPHGASNTPVS